MITLEKEEFQTFLKTADSQALANVVLIYRVFGTMKDSARECMTELMKRKLNGDIFDFKNFIEQNYNKYKINVNLQAPYNVKQKISSNIMEGVIGGLISEVFNQNNDEIEEDDNLYND